MDSPDRYWCGIEKPFPWLGLTIITASAIAGVAAAAAGMWAIIETCDSHLAPF